MPASRTNHGDRGAASPPVEQAPGGPTLHGIGALAKALFDYAPRRTTLAILLLLTAGVTEAFGIVMLIPLLHVVGLDDETSEGNPVVETIENAANALGVELSLANVLLLFLALAVIRAVAAWQREVLVATIQQGFVDWLRGRLYAAMAGARWDYLVSQRQSDVQHVLSSTLQRVGNGAFNVLQMGVSAVLTAGQLAVLIAISPAISVLALATGGVLFLIYHPLTRRSRVVGEQLTQANRGLFGLSSDFMTGLKLVKGHGAESHHVQRYRQNLREARERQLDYQRISALAGASSGLFMAAILSGMVWFAVALDMASISELAVTALIFMRVVPILSRVQAQFRGLANTLPAYEYATSMYEGLRQAAERGRPASRADESAQPVAVVSPSAQMPKMSLKTGIALRHVSFAYTEGVDVLRDLSLDVYADELTVVAGPSGAGKSTLADVLLGLLAPTVASPEQGANKASPAESNGWPDRGEVLIDGQPLVGDMLRAWRKSIAYAPQEPYLFHDTIRANLLWPRIERSEDELWEVLRLCVADTFVAGLPQGLDTTVGDRGSLLSGGERQRIALARALLRQPSLLLLDEATGQLDAGTERQVASMLRSLRGQTTVVAIAHRPGLMQAADRIILLEAGRVAGIGSWQELRHRLVAPAPNDD